MEIVLGIDFGTSNSCCSYFDGFNYKIIPNEYGNYTYPTCIFFDQKSDDILYAQSAYNNPNQIENIILNIKRLIGNSNNESNIKLIYNNKLQIFTVNQIIIYYLKYLKQISEKFTNNTIKNIVITVPAYFSDPQRNQLKFCCQESDLNVIRIMNEPTAAVLAYCWEKINKQNTSNNILVIDCGGGTTDYSIVNADFEDNLFEVINVYGNNDLGGEDLTLNLVNHVINKINLSLNINLDNKKRLKIRQLCEKAKIELSYNESSIIYIENIHNDKDMTIHVSRSLFYSINRDFFESIKSGILKVTKYKTINIDEIIFVGGTTRIPLFKDICKQIFDSNIIINNKLNPDHTISIGAAIQGALLVGNVQRENYDVVLMDITPMSLGIKTYDEKMSIIISKNTPIPVSKSQLFTNSEDNLKNILIEIYQGDYPLVKDNIYLGSFELSNLNPNVQRGHMRIKVTFTINSDGILIVSAKESDSDNTSEIIVSKYDHKSLENDDLDLEKIL